MEKRKRKEGHVLRQQKPARNIRRERTRRKLLIMTGTLAAFTAIASFFAYNYPTLFKGPSRSEITWSVQITIKGADQLDLETTHAIGAQSKAFLKFGDQQELSSLAETLQATYLAERVSVVRTGYSQVHVLLQQRRPVLRVASEKQRLSTALGQVYGDASDDHSDLPLLTGLLDQPRRSYKMNKDATLALTNNEHQTLMNAIELRQLAAKHHMEPASIRFVAHRGFEVQLPQNDLKVMIGEPPFEQKLVQLKNLLDKAITNGQEIVRIELDYNGKAFIKERKM